MDSSTVLSAASVRRLLMWYLQHRRELPWRKTRDPYRIWISEVLLQQTQANTVKEYYERFFAAFPTVKSLAEAPFDELLKVWEGCGYYARARNLHKAAKQIMVNGGQLPQTARELQRLPGIGVYTAAAISSIAFDEAAPVVDGNVERVLARVLCEKRVLNSAAAAKRVRKVAAEIMRTGVELKFPPREINQAMMELGAIICRPRSALCGKCALRSDCRSRKQLGDVTVLPKRTRARKLPHYDIGAAIIRKHGKILITKRPPDGLLGGLWEFPGGKVQYGESLEACVEREIREELGIEIQVGKLFGKTKHSFTHFRITLHCYDCSHVSGRLRKLGVADYRWVTAIQFSKYAFPKADRVIIEKLKKEPGLET